MCYQLLLPMLAAVVLLFGLSASNGADPPTQIGDCRNHTLASDIADLPRDAAPIQVKLEVARDSIVPGENFPIRVTVMNPNDTTVHLRHVGYEQPWIYVSAANGEFCRVGRAGGVNPSAVITPILEPGEAATAEFLIFIRLTGLNRFPRDGGYTVRLLAAGALSGYDLSAPDRLVVFRCESDETRLQVRPMTSEETAALELLTGRVKSVEPQMTKEGKSWPQIQQDRISFFESFLGRFGTTPYAKEARALLCDALDKRLEAHRRDPDAVGKFQEQFMKCVLQSLEDGPAYSSFVSSQLLENLAIAGKWEQAIEVIDALLRFPTEDRTVDGVLADIARYFGPLEKLRKHGLPEATADRFASAIIRVVERCLSWDGYRERGFGDATFQFLAGQKRWDLLQQAADQTLRCAERCSVLGSTIDDGMSVSERDKAAALRALDAIPKMRQADEEDHKQQ